MSGPFKMKGWSGSPIRQKPKINLKQSLQNIQKSISNTFKGIGLKPKTIAYDPTTGKSTSGFGLTSLEKAQAKKSGMSEWQWKTDRNKSGTRANRYARDNKLGKYAVEEEVVDDFGGQYGDDDWWRQPEDIVSTVESDPDVNIIKGQTITTPTEVDYGTGMTTKDWKQESSTGWSLHELTQERKKFDPGSPEYENIRKAINLGYKTGGPVEGDTAPEQKLTSSGETKVALWEGTKVKPHQGTPSVKEAKEGEYYENTDTDQIYLFKNGKYIEQ